jgi:type I restriction enzyme S subunit
MEVRPGFKQTEVGDIPDDWDAKTLKQAAEISAGINKPLSEMGSGALYVTVQDLYDGTSIRTNRLNRIRLSPAEVEAKALSVGDIVFGKSSVKRDGIGYPSQFLGCGEPVVFSGFTYRARARQGIADAVFLFYALRTEKTRRWLIDNSQSSALTNINQKIADVIPVTLPRVVPEQRAIAAALSDVDALLGGLDRLIAKKRDLKQAAMQQLLTGQTRLPGFSGDWDVKRLGEISEISMGRTPPRLNQALWGRGYTWLSIADLQSKVVSESKEEITAFAASTMTIIPKGTLLMSFKLSIGRLCFAGRDLFTNEAICGFNKLQANPEFLYYALSRTDFSLYGKQAVKGYTLNKESLKIVEVRLPSPPEQTAIAAVLSDMDAELAALEARRAKTRDLKQAMMQELLTGKTRLVKPETAHV